MEGKFKSPVSRAWREQKALERKAARTGRDLSGREKARYQRVRDTAKALVYSIED